MPNLPENIPNINNVNDVLPPSVHLPITMPSIPKTTVWQQTHKNEAIEGKTEIYFNSSSINLHHENTSKAGKLQVDVKFEPSMPFIKMFATMQGAKWDSINKNYTLKDGSVLSPKEFGEKFSGTMQGVSMALNGMSAFANTIGNALISGNFNSPQFAQSMIKTFGSVLSSALGSVLPGASFIGTAINFLAGLFGGGNTKSPEQIISEQITAFRKETLKHFKMVFDNQALILKNLSLGFRDTMQSIKADGDLTRLAISGVSNQITKSTEFLSNQIDSLRYQIGDDIFSLQNSFDINLGMLSLQFADQTSDLKNLIFESSNMLSERLSSEFEFLKADFKNFDFKNDFNFSKTHLDIMELKDITINLPATFNGILENTFLQREIDLFSAGNFAISKIQTATLDVDAILKKMYDDTIKSIDNLYDKQRIEAAQCVLKLLAEGTQEELDESQKTLMGIINENLEMARLGKNQKIYYFQKALNEQRKKDNLPLIPEDGISFLETQKALNCYKNKLQMQEDDSFKYLIM